MSCNLQGFKDWGLLEDVELVRRLNKLSTPAIVPVPIKTSGRRYHKLGFWKNIIMNQMILFGWAVGVDVQQLSSWYERSGAQNSSKA